MAAKGYSWSNAPRLAAPDASSGGLPRWEALTTDAVGNVIEFWGFKHNQGRVWALLYLRGNKEHEAAASEHGIEAIDLLVVNLYPFEATIAKPGVKLAEAIEQGAHCRASRESLAVGNPKRNAAPSARGLEQRRLRVRA